MSARDDYPLVRALDALNGGPSALDEIDRLRAEVAHRMVPAPTGDVIHPRIQYLEQWIRDCQAHNEALAGSLAKAEDAEQDARALVAAKNTEIRKLQQLHDYVNACRVEAPDVLHYVDADHYDHRTDKAYNLLAVLKSLT